MVEAYVDPLGVDAMGGDVLVKLVVALAVAVIVVGSCAQGRLRHAILWLLGAVPREKPSLTATIPRGHAHWSLVGQLSYDAPRDEEAPPS